MSAAAGTSTMMPIGTGGTPNRAASSSTMALASRSSASIATIGNMMWIFPKADARSMART